VVFTIDDVADASDRHSEDEGYARHIGEPGNVQAAPPGVCSAGENSARDGSVNSDAALVDQHDLHEVLAVVVPLIDDVEQSRADDGSNYAPHGRGHGGIFRVASTARPTDGQPDPNQRPDRGKQPMPGKLEEGQACQGRVDIDRDVGNYLHSAPFLGLEVGGRLRRSIWLRLQSTR